MATTPVYQLRIGSTNVARLQKVQDTVSRAWVTTADVSCTLVDATDAAVAGAVDLSMPYAAGATASAGEYRTELPPTLELTTDAIYTLVITAVAQDGSTREFRLPCIAVAG
jgi:hypothetical protein